MKEIVGLDLGKCKASVNVMNVSTGKVRMNANLNNTREQYETFFKRFPEGTQVVLEAGYNWYWVVDLLQEMGMETLLANPLQVKAIVWAKVKTDKVDAKTLATLGRLDCVPACYISTPEVRKNRELLRYRAGLVSVRTMIKNRIHAIVDRYGVSHSYSDLFSANGKEFLSKMRITDEVNFAISGLLKIVDLLNDLVKQADEKIERLYNNNKQAQILDSIPGVGKHWGTLIAYEAGDINRFVSSQAFSSYCGLTPTIIASGKKNFHGPTSRQSNHWLKLAFTEAATAAVRHKSDEWHSLRFEQLKKRKGYQKAIVAIAREFAVSAYHMLKNNETYKPRRFNSANENNSGIGRKDTDPKRSTL